MLDEVLEPNLLRVYDYRTRGVIWDEPAITIPVPRKRGTNDGGDDDLIPWKDARFTENWAMLVYNKSGKRWRKIEVTIQDLYGIDPETPDPDPLPSPRPRSTAGKVLPFRRRLT